MISFFAYVTNIAVGVINEPGRKYKLNSTVGKYVTMLLKNNKPKSTEMASSFLFTKRHENLKTGNYMKKLQQIDSVTSAKQH